MRTIVLLTIFTILFSCSSCDDSRHQTYRGGNFEFSIVDSNGNDLLNPENKDSLNPFDIRLFHKENGEYEEVINANAKHPGTFLIFKDKKEYRIRIFLNSSKNEALPETMVQWDKNKSNIIKAKFYRSISLLRLEKVWLDNKLIWDGVNNNAPYYKLVME